MDEWQICESRAGSAGRLGSCGRGLGNLRRGGGIFTVANRSPVFYRRPMLAAKWLPWTVSAVGLTLAIAMGSRGGFAQRSALPDAAGAASGQLWIHAVPLDDRQHMLLVVDPQLRNAAVYHVDGPTGGLVLKSTRNITWDLMVGDFNAQEPKPSALRRMLEVGPETRPIGQNSP